MYIKWNNVQKSWFSPFIERCLVTGVNLRLTFSVCPWSHLHENMCPCLYTAITPTTLILMMVVANIILKWFDIIPLPVS